MRELYVNIDVDDLEKATRFYVDAFGLHVSRRFGDAVVELRGATTPIHLLKKAPGTTPAATSALRDYSRHWTPVHLDFVVDDIEAAVKTVVTAGGKLERPISTSKWGRLANLSDPFGHGLCLLQFLGRGYDELVSGS